MTGEKISIIALRVQAPNLDLAEQVADSFNSWLSNSGEQMFFQDTDDTGDLEGLDIQGYLQGQVYVFKVSEDENSD